MSDFSPAVVIVHPSGTNNVGYESAFPLWVTGSTTVFPSVQVVTGSVIAVLTGTVQTTVTNFPAVQTITGTVSLTAQPIQVTTTGSLPVVVQSLPNITGSVNVTNSIFNVTGNLGIGSTVTVTGSMFVTTTGSIPVLQKQSQTSFSSSIAASNSVSQVLLSASNNRLFASVYNDSTAKLYLLLGTPATTAVFTVRMDGQTYYEVPTQYTGVVTGIWSANVGDARMTEVRQ